MTVKTTKIPQRQECVNKEHPYIGGAKDVFDDEKDKPQSQVNKEVDDTLAFHQSEISALDSQNYESYSAESGDTLSDILPAEGAADTIYRVGNWDGGANSGQGGFDGTKYSEYAWKVTGEDTGEYRLMAVRTQIGEVFDISAYHATGGELATYSDLTAALDSNNGGGVPQSLQKGGMRIQFIQGTVQSSDKYVQYFLTKNTWSDDVEDWEITANIGDGYTPDLIIADDNENVIVAFENGHVKTKNFNSSKNASTTASGLMSTSDKTKLDGIEADAEKNDIETSDNSDYDAAISDENGNIIVMFKDGGIKTKNFDSEEITAGETERLDFAVNDASGDTIIGVNEGYPVTKNFDGKQIDADVTKNKNDITDIRTVIPIIDSVYGWEELDASNPLKKIRFDAGLTPVIQHWGFIGDSLSSGCHGYDIPNGQTGIDIYDYSWGQFICRLCGTEGYNFSYGGGSAKTWLTNQSRGWPVAQLEQNFKQAYTIALGINDSSLLNTLYSDGVGDADTDLVVDSSNPYDYSNNNEDTFVGCYGGIIQRLRSVNPRCRIFVLTMLDKDFQHSVHLQMDAEIRKIASKFENVYVIDLATYAPIYYNSPLHDTLVYWSHLTSVGYVWLAYLINTYIDWIIRNNLYAFRDIAFIGTDKYMDSNVH